jgi:hypothetical protein
MIRTSRTSTSYDFMWDPFGFDPDVRLGACIARGSGCAT